MKTYVFEVEIEQEGGRALECCSSRPAGVQCLGLHP